MTALNNILHTPFHINCNNFVIQLSKPTRFYKYNNTYLIPYFCKYVNHTSGQINGNFVYPMWNTLQRVILTKGTTFNYSYIIGNGILIEVTSTALRDYRIQGIPFSSINACEATLLPNSVLLFPIKSDIANPLIENGLL